MDDPKAAASDENRPDGWELRIDGPVAHLTLMRAGKANALRAADCARLRGFCAELAAREDVVAVIVGSEGERVFCAGGDLSEIEAARASPERFRAFNAMLTETFGAAAALPQLTVAKMNGTAAGAGLALALACDLRIAADHAAFFYPVVNRRVIPPAADAHRLTRLIGPARAKALLIGAQRLDAAEALAWGLIDAAVPAAALEAAAAERVAAAAETSRSHVAALKALTDWASDGAVAPAYEALFAPAPQDHGAEP